MSWSGTCPLCPKKKQLSPISCHNPKRKWQSLFVVGTFFDKKWRAIHSKNERKCVRRNDGRYYYIHFIKKRFMLYKMFCFKSGLFHGRSDFIKRKLLISEECTVPLYWHYHTLICSFVEWIARHYLSKNVLIMNILC